MREKGVYDLHREFSLRCAEGGDWEGFLRHASIAAHVAWENRLAIRHSLWRDDRLEERLRELGELARTAIPSRPPRRGGLAFVASTLYDTGGHSEALRLWCELLREDYPRRSVIVTGGLGLEHCFPRLEASLRGSGVRMIKMNGRDSLTARLRALLDLLTGDGYACAFFFIHPHDAPAAAAAYGCAGDPPCVLFNHADIDFWLGASCCDHYVDFRTIGAEHSLRERGVARTRVIPLTTDLARVPDIRASLGIPRHATLSISLGSFWKTLTDPDFCFFRAVSRILEKHPHHHHLFLTNPPEPETLAGLMPMEREAARRFMITGPYADVRPFYSSSDFLVETFPLVGGSVRVEAMAMGLPVVAFSHPEQPLYSSTDALGPDYPYTASSEEDVERIASFFIENAAARQACGSRLRERFRDTVFPPLVREELLRLLEEVAA